MMGQCIVLQFGDFLLLWILGEGGVFDVFDKCVFIVSLVGLDMPMGPCAFDIIR